MKLFSLFCLSLQGNMKATMEHKAISAKFKHVRVKSYDSPHPLYDMARSICNPEGESCGDTVEYKGMTFQPYSCSDTYYDENGIAKLEVNVYGLNEPEDRWWVYRRNAEELAKEAKKREEQEFKPHTVDYSYEKGRISWINTYDYNERRELIHMEQAFYGDGLCDEFSETPLYTLISEISYEYDEYGNWVLSYLHCVDGLQPDELTIREIEYQ